DFVDEDDARRVLFALLKQVAYAAGAYANEHLHEIRTGDAEEGNIGFTGHSARQQGLARAGMTYQEDTLRDTAAQLLELLRFAQEFDDLTQLFFGLIHAGHVFESNFLLLHGEQAGAALAEAQRLVSSGLHLPDHDEPQHAEQQERRELDQSHGPGPRLWVLQSDPDFVGLQSLEHFRIVGGNHQVETSAVFVLPVGLAALNLHFQDVALAYVVHEFAVSGLGIFGAVRSTLEHLPNHHAHQQQHCPEDNRFECRIHSDTPKIFALAPWLGLHTSPSTTKNASRTKKFAALLFPGSNLLLDARRTASGLQVHTLTILPL